MALLVLGACVSPPARPDACREEITIWSASESMVWLAGMTRGFQARSLVERYDPRGTFGQVLAGLIADDGLERDRTIQRCIDDHWSRTFLRCYSTTRDPWPCARRELRQPACLRLENALFGMIDHDPGGRCGEPARHFF